MKIDGCELRVNRVMSAQKEIHARGCCAALRRR